MYAILGCGQKEFNVHTFLLLDHAGLPIHVAGQFWDMLQHLLDRGVDEVALLTANRPTLVRIKNNRKGWEERDEAPFLLVALVGLDYSEVPPVPQYFDLPPPDLS